MIAASPTPRYDRIVSLVLLVLLGLAVVFLIDINPNILRARLGGDLPVITVSWLLIASLVIIASTGADVFIRAHPQMQTRSLPTLRLGPLALEAACRRCAWGRWRSSWRPASGSCRRSRSSRRSPSSGSSARRSR